MNYDIILEQDYAHPPERVWRALTDSAALADWLMANDFEPQVGHKFQFRAKPMPGWRGFVECEVIEVDEPRRLAYTWHGDESWQAPTIVRWTLEPTERGTILRLEHTNLQEPWGRELNTMLSQGWKKMLAKEIVRVMDRMEASA